MKHRLYIGIDPSISECGYGIIDRNGLLDFGLIEGNPKWSLEWRCLHVCREIKRIRSLFHQNATIVVEMPQTWSTSRGVPAKYGGSLQKLFFLVGVIYGNLHHPPASQIRLVTVSEWKGNIPKKVTFNRMVKKYKLQMQPTARNLNVTDAIGLADYEITRRKT